MWQRVEQASKKPNLTPTAFLTPTVKLNKV